MATLSSMSSLIIVDKEGGQTNGTTTIKYEKEFDDELFERIIGKPWSSVNVHVRTGLGDVADKHGSYPITLDPGQVYEAAIYEAGHGPLTTDPIQIAELKVFCIWKKPEPRKLITDQNRNSGGTYHRHQIATNVPTDIAFVGVSQKAPIYGSVGVPSLPDPEGAPSKPLTNSQNHFVEILPLLPGNHYFFVALVVDAIGNWEVLQEEFDTLRRKLTIQFTTLHIFNDGDPSDVGEGEFWFDIKEEGVNIKEFHMPEFDIDDWSETDRPYAVGFAHIGNPTKVRKPEVQIRARGLEHDGIFENDENAASPLNYTTLPLPAGFSKENVQNAFSKLDCPAITTGDDFHFGVDVIWSVEYVP